MTKKTGFKVRIEAFVEVDKKDFKKQADAYATMAKIEETGTLPADFLETATILGVTAKAGSAEIE